MRKETNNEIVSKVIPCIKVYRINIILGSQSHIACFITLLITKELTKMFKYWHTFAINRRLLPIKCHFFVFIGGLAGTQPFFPVIGKDLGISPTVNGMLFSVIPILGMLFKTSCGIASDHFQNIKMMMIVSSLLCILCSNLVFLIPRVSENHMDNLNFDFVATCSTNHYIFKISHYNFSKSMCLSEKITLNYKCSVECLVCSERNTSSETLCQNVCQRKVEKMINTDLRATYERLSVNSSEFLNFTNSILDKLNISNCICEQTLSCHTICKLESYITDCKQEKDTLNLLSKGWVWAFFLFVSSSEFLAGNLVILSVAVCYELLEDKPGLFGKQRLWGTIGWSLSILAIGYFNDLATEYSGSSSVNRIPGFIVMSFFLISDCAIIASLKIKSIQRSENILKDVALVFKSKHILIFAVNVCFIGTLTGILWFYQVWFLEEMGSTQLLIGLVFFIQGFISEAPFLFISGWIIKRIGHSNALILTFSAFGIRFIFYYFITNPWYILPVELTHGWTRGVFYATMTSFAKTEAPEGTEATMQALLGGLYDGIGISAGSLLGGIAFDRLGSHRMYLTAGIVSLVFAVLNTATHYSKLQKLKTTILEFL